MPRKKPRPPPGQQDLFTYGQQIEAILDTPTEIDYREFFRKLSLEEFGEFGLTGLHCPIAADQQDSTQ